MKVQYLVKQKVHNYLSINDRPASWMARQLGMSRQNFYRFLNKSSFTVDELLLISQFINIPITQLFKIVN